MIFKPLSEIAKIDISGVNKKIDSGEKLVKLCNFTDVYYNWAVTGNNVESFMIASANDNEIERFTLKKGYVAITKDSETRDDIGIPCLIADNLENTILGYHCALIIPDENQLYGPYLNAYLNSKMARTYFSNQASGSGQRYTLTIGGIGNVKVPVIEMSEQIKIGDLFSKIDKKIENNKILISELESMAKTLYDYWFLQFEFPNEEGKPYKSSGGKMIYNEELKREIPEGWEVSELLDLVDWITNSQPPKSDFKYFKESGYVRFIQNRDYGSSNHVTYIPFKESLNIVDRLDILMDKYGDAGVVRYGLSGAFNVALAHIKPKNNFMREYIRSVLLSNSMYTYFHNSCMASTRASLSEENLKKVYVVVPSEEILINYENKLSTIRNMVLKKQDENQELASLRDFLLPLLMNGQVTFKE